MEDVYRKLYDGPWHYGQAKHNKCPGVRYLPYYKDSLRGDIVDLGCGTGDTLDAIGSGNLGFDYALRDACLITPGDNLLIRKKITEPFLSLNTQLAETALCIDVLEHIADEDLEGLFFNLSCIKRQIITTFTGSHILDGVELHINQKNPEEWEELLSTYFEIVHHAELDAPHRRLFICERK